MQPLLNNHRKSTIQLASNPKLVSFL